jgi:methylmalonyl-CoA mutase
MVDRWNKVKSEIAVGTAPTGLKLPRLALPEIDEAGEITRYLLGEGLPGEFPFTNGAYREMYLEPLREAEGGSYGKSQPNGKNGHKKNGHAPAKAKQAEEPTRLFSGFGLAEDTNKRFHYLTGHQRSARLSTAFDGPTLYGIDSDADGVFGKIGEGGLAIDTYEDMVRLYDGFDMGSPDFSASMTISGRRPSSWPCISRRRKSASAPKSCRTCAAPSRPTFLRKCRRRTKRFSRLKLRFVFFAT